MCCVVTVGLQVLSHPVAPAFSYTFEKTQGATMDRLVLSLADLEEVKLGQMDVRKLFVALSRVRRGAHLAVLPISIEDMKYLSKKRFPEKLRVWAQNYDDEGDWKSGCLLPRDLRAQFEKIPGGNLRRATAKALAAIARNLGVYKTIYVDVQGRKKKKAKQMSKAQLVRAVTPAFQAWRNSNPPPSGRGPGERKVLQPLTRSRLNNGGPQVGVPLP